jgi:truncated hemoglobin YjbI
LGVLDAGEVLEEIGFETFRRLVCYFYGLAKDRLRKVFRRIGGKSQTEGLMDFRFVVAGMVLEVLEDFF